MLDLCPVCNTPAETTIEVHKTEYLCPRCGHFFVGAIAKHFLPEKLTVTQRANLSGYLRENPGIFIADHDLKSLQNIRTPTVGEKADKLLLAIAKRFPTAGEMFHINPFGILHEWAVLTDAANSGQNLRQYTEDEATQLRWAAVAWTANSEELEYLLINFLQGQSWIQSDEDGMPNYFRITPSGWARIDELTRGIIASDKGFVAMSFRDEFKELFAKGLEPGIRRAGYEALRVDRVEHNNRIDDEIIASIRRCKFLVADFSVDRGGIYFEAGFAAGLGRPVIWAVREDQKDNIHFDNRQYNFIRWEPEKLEELAIALKNRIEATIGKGPLSMDEK